MSKQKQSTDSCASKEKSPSHAAGGNHSKESPVKHALRSLVSQLSHPDYNHSQPPFQAPIIEVEHEGLVYSLFCRKKQPCTAFVELSPRERDIARMIATGLPNKTIASSLEISEWTVSTHLRRIFAKLGVSCRAAMVSKWLESHNHCNTAHDAPARSSHPFQTHRDAHLIIRDTASGLTASTVTPKLVARS